MKIIRNNIEYELTEKELFEAYCEQEHLWDVSYVDAMLPEWGAAYDSIPEEILSEAIDDIAYRMRHFANKHDIHDYDALEMAINEYLEGNDYVY